MKKLILGLLILFFGVIEVYSQCYTIDTNQIPFSRQEGYLGFYETEYPSILVADYHPELSLTYPALETLEVDWSMKVSNLDAAMYVFGKHTSDAGGWFVSYATGGSGPYVEFYTNNNGYINIYQLNDTNWHHYTIRYVVNTRFNLMCYVDDNLTVRTSIQTDWGITSKHFVFCVGHKYAIRDPYTIPYPEPASYSFRGYLDFLKIKLTSQEVLGPKIFNWSFDEGAGEFAHDSTTYKIMEFVVPGGEGGYCCSTHLRNGSTINYDKNNAIWHKVDNGEVPAPFSSVGAGVKKWQFTSKNTWEGSSVYSTVVWNGYLIAGGIMNRINAYEINYDNGTYSKDIAAYSYSMDNWIALDSGLLGPNRTNDLCENVTLYKNTLIATGAFLTAGGVLDTVNCIAQLDSINGEWHGLGSGFSNPDTDRNLFSYIARQWGDDLYVGGDFRTAGGNECHYIAKWNDSAWSDLDVGTNYEVWALAVYDDALFVGGTFSRAGSSNLVCNNIAKWNGTSWEQAGNIWGWVAVLYVYNNELYAGGVFDSADGHICNGFAKYDTTTNSWVNVGTGTDGLGKTVRAMTEYNGNLYITGSFYYMNGVPCYDLCRFDGTDFCAISNGIEELGRSLTVYNNGLYVGGNFYSADGGYYSNIFRYDESAGDFNHAALTSTPSKFSLEQNYPNPFNPATNIKYTIPNTGLVKLSIYDILGREVKTLVNEIKNAGTYSVEFNASNYASGVYFYRLKVGDEYSDSKKMLLIK